jgi:hypothetical protein
MEILSMRKTIERTITQTNVTSGIVGIEKGLPVIKVTFTDEFTGILNDEKALKEVQKLHGNSTVILEKSEINDRYEISVEDFMKHATKISSTNSNNQVQPDNQEPQEQGKEAEV